MVLAALMVAGAAARADDELDWVQVHVELAYTRTGTPATTGTGHFKYELQAQFDQLLTRVAPSRGSRWPAYVLPDEGAPRLGKISGSASLDAEGTFGKYSGHAHLQAALKSLDQVWIESIKPQPAFYSGLGANIKVFVPLAGSVNADLPGQGGKPATAILLWPSPVSYNDELAAFVSEGDVHVWPPFGPRPKDEQQAMLYDATKAAMDPGLAGVGGLTAPTATAQLQGGPADWTLTMTAEGEVATGTGGHYTQHVRALVRLTPRTLPLPASSEK